MRSFKVDEVAEVSTRLPVKPPEQLEQLLAGTVRAKSTNFERCVAPIVPRGMNGLLLTVHLAFSEHRALTLSPDDVWMAILNGFAHHVGANAEALRERFVEFSGQRTLTIFTADASDWSTNIALFEKALSDALNPGLMRALTSPFSTTNADTRVAFAIASMDAFSSYFDFEMVSICGIPRITLTGTVDDWMHLRERFRVLAEFDLQWWNAALGPVLNQFVAAAGGQTDLDFWQSIYKPKSAYGGDTVTGWLVRLFPYLEGEDGVFARNPFAGKGWVHEPISPFSIPQGLCRAPLRHRWPEGEELLCLHSGIFGVQQLDDASLATVIGWTVSQSPTHELLDTIARVHSLEAKAGGTWVGPVSVPALLNEFTARFGGGSLFGGELVMTAPTPLDASWRDAACFVSLVKGKPGEIMAARLGLHFASLRDGRRLVFVREHEVEHGQLKGRVDRVLLIAARDAEPPYQVIAHSMLEFVQRVATQPFPPWELKEKWSPHT